MWEVFCCGTYTAKLNQLLFYISLLEIQMLSKMVRRNRGAQIDTCHSMCVP